MIELVIDNSACSIQGLNAEDFRKLRNVLSYDELTRGRWGQYKTVRRFLMDKYGGFPTGLLYLVYSYLKERSLEVRSTDLRIRPRLNQCRFDTLFISKSYEGYPEQIEAAKAAMFHEGRGIICAPTGVGKSFIAALVCDEFRVPTLIVVPSLELKKQLTHSLRGWFGDNTVGPLVKGKPKHFITIENVDALDTKKPMWGIDLVIIDEFHHAGAKTYRDLNKKAWAGVYFKLGMTATPFRSKSTERLLLESVLSRVIYNIPYATAVAKGYIVPMEAYIYRLPKINLKGSGKNFHAVYKELVVERKDRNALISHLMHNLGEAGVSALCLVKQIEHGKALQQDTDFPFAEGENECNRQLILEFNLRETDVMIGTMGVLGEGVDTKPCEYVILAGGGKSKNQFMQCAGRGFRVFPDKSSCKLILIDDPSHKWVHEHVKACVKYLAEEYGIAPTELPLPDLSG